MGKRRTLDVSPGRVDRLQLISEVNNFGGHGVDFFIQGLVGGGGRAVALHEAQDDLPVVQLLFATFLKKRGFLA